jgi:prevent-host-death family protein
MKIVNLRDAKATLSSVIDEAQQERVLITRHGKPTALIIGVEGEDLEDLLTRTDPSFWRMIEDRRAAKRPRVSLAEMESRSTKRTKRSVKKRAQKKKRTKKG